MASLLHSQSVVSTTSDDALAIDPSIVIPAGSLVVVAAEKGTGGTNPTGAACSDDQANTWALAASSVRAGTHDLSLHWCLVEDAITGLITVDWNAFGNRRAIVMSVWEDAGALLAASAIYSTVDNTSGGAHGLSTSPSATATPAAAGLVIGAATRNGGATITATDTMIESVTTAAGSSDRGVAQQYRIDEDVDTQASAWTLASTGWAACTAVFEDTGGGPGPGGGLSEVVVAGAKKPVVARHVVVGGVKKTVVNEWVVVGGVKKPLV